MPKAFLEYVASDDTSSLMCQRQRLRRFSVGYHFHPEYELTLIQNGAGQRRVGDHPGIFGPGDLVLAGPNLPHAYHSWEDAPAHAVVIKFKKGLFDPAFFELPEMRPIKRLMGDAKRGLHFPKPRADIGPRMERIAAQKPSARRIALLLELLADLAQTRSHALAREGFALSAKRAQCDRLRRVLHYVEAHWDADVRLEAVANVAKMHPQSLSRFLRQKLGQTLARHLASLRLGRAAKALLESERTVADIAFSCGFNNLSNFNRQFKACYGHTPSAYRKL